MSFGQQVAKDNLNFHWQRALCKISTYLPKKTDFDLFWTVMTLLIYQLQCLEKVKGDFGGYGLGI